MTPRPDARTFAELLINCEEDRKLRAVVVGMLREPTADAEDLAPGGPQFSPAMKKVVCGLRGWVRGAFMRAIDQQADSLGPQPDFTLLSRCFASIGTKPGKSRSASRLRPGWGLGMRPSAPSPKNTSMVQPRWIGQWERIIFTGSTLPTRHPKRPNLVSVRKAKGR